MVVEINNGRSRMRSNVRNNLGERFLDRLRDKGEPILVSKGKKLRAVLVTPEQFGITSFWISADTKHER